MLEHKKIQYLDDYFVELNSRKEKGVYFYRINGCSEEVRNFIKKYYDVARRTGVVIEGKMMNPDEKNLAYYNEIMGTSFQLSLNFIDSSLKKWLPRMNDVQRKNVTEAIYNNLIFMKNSGKNENMLKNAYIKFMCWLYYKFERIVNKLGDSNIPKILYEGNISNYELMLISILSNAGCDVVILQYSGDNMYLNLDPKSMISYNLEIHGLQPFEDGFSIKRIREEIQQDINNERLYGVRPKLNNCTNAWIKGKILDDIKTCSSMRGNDNRFFYNCFCRINGVEDKMTYVNELFQLQQELKNQKRKVVIVNEQIPKPTTEEVASIKRGNYVNKEQVILDLSSNITYSANIELQRIMHKAFVDILLNEWKNNNLNINRLTNKAVYLLCWVKRYMTGLFSNWKMPEIGCFIYLGGCKDENEAMLLRYLSRLPIDVLILCPNLDVKCCLNDNLLYEVNYEESMIVDKYPEGDSQVHIGTVAYHAERELDTLMYQDSGMYRNQQYNKANIICLQTMYEEIKILWDQELKYRPYFDIVDGIVNIPVIFSKISGVKDGLVPQYWSSIKSLITPDTTVITKVPYIDSSAPNPMKAFSTEFYKNGKLQRNKIKNHPKYKYGILREEMQEFMLDKLQSMIEQKLIKGIGENGTEYTVVAEILNLPMDIVRSIQKFDFTKKNPKIIYINTLEKVISLEDSILVAFLNLIGFDVIFFVPTGYQSVEKYFNKKIMEEHQIGEYKYDLQVPDLTKASLNNTRLSWRDKIFKRGN